MVINQTTRSLIAAGLAAGVVSSVGYAWWSIQEAYSPLELNRSVPDSMPALHLLPAGSKSEAAPKEAEPPVSAAKETPRPSAPPTAPVKPLEVAVPPAVPHTAEGRPAEEKPAPPPRTPELAGTMLGNRPSAVFRGASQLIVVPVGGMIDGWRVITVHHGEVLLRNGKQTLQLGKSADLSSETPPDTAVLPERSIQFFGTSENGAQYGSGTVQLENTETRDSRPNQ